MSGEDLRRSLASGEGKCFVALFDSCVVGTMSIMKKNIRVLMWRMNVGYNCYIAILPQYQGRGILKTLNVLRDKYMEEKGLSLLLLDTAVNNLKACYVYEHDGFCKLQIRRFPRCSYDSIVFAKGYNWRWHLVLGLFSKLIYNLSLFFHKKQQ